MSLSKHLFWILVVFVVLPVAVLAAYALTGNRLAVPAMGRGYVVQLTLPELEEQVVLPDVFGPQDASRPLVVIDAGHGGRDPGASGIGVKEKDVVLGLAIALRDELLKQGGIRVALTREDDRLLVLAERPEIARRLGADLFLSIHADSAGEASSVRGASIYTLSNEASSDAAARFAARENDADRLNGVSVEGQSEAVSDILVELSQRRTQEDSSGFSSLIIREASGTLRFHPQAKRSAELAVLRAPDIPSVLFESGFITNPEDARRLTSEEGKAQFASVMARAIQVYFARISDE
ncbi:MAG: N-acetylmuramoyl-L-alanine amidase [Marinomonas sp.]